VIKKDELANPNSCINRAQDDEPTFVLLARDPAAPQAILDWVHRRIVLAKNKMSDQQIQEATQIAKDMTDWRLRNVIRN
jgi:hypothetical protein